MRPIPTPKHPALGRYSCLTTLVAVCVSCAAATATPPPAHVQLDDELSLFRLAVETVRIQENRLLRVDPWPLVADPTVTQVGELRRALASSATVAARTNVLKELGVEVTDDATRGKCPGVLVPPATSDGAEDNKAACPRERVALAAFGLPRRGGAFLPSSRVNERDAGAARGEWAIRALVTRLGPGGASTTVYDLVVRQEDGKWRLARTVALMFID